MKHLLTKYYQQRFDWAFEARDAFLNQFKVFETGSKKVDSKRLVISVYGPTQVGKSTLILTLLGVKDQYLAEISKFLRGKRESGESSTVTVTIYQISETNHFQIKLPNNAVMTIETPKQLEEQLVILRKSIEEGIINSVDPVIIAIPKHMFDNPELTLEIIDLPGIESAEQKEIEHVKRCIQYWIPNSHVCLIVNTANDLTFLRDIEMPQLMQWYDYENNYFLILTRALTPSSVKKAITKGEISNTGDVIEHYKANIYDILFHSKGTIFPIEIGDSLKKLADNEYDLALSMLEQLKQRLSEIDIQKISFNYLSSYYRDVLKQEQLELTKLKNIISAKESYIQELKKNNQSLCNKITNQLEIYNEGLMLLKQKQEEIDKIYSSTLSFNRYETCIEEKVKKSELTKRASGLNKLFSNLIIELEEMLTGAFKKVDQNYNDVMNQFDVPKVNINEKISLEFLLWDNSRVDNYFSTKNYLTQQNVMMYHLIEVVENQFEHIEHFKKKLNEQLMNLMNDTKTKIHNQETLLKINNADSDQVVKNEIEQLQGLINQYSKAEKLWENDKDHAMKYREHFVKHFIKRKNELLKMSISKSVEDKYLASLFLAVLGQDAQKIIDSMELENYGQSENSKSTE